MCVSQNLTLRKLGKARCTPHKDPRLPGTFLCQIQSDNSPSNMINSQDQDLG